MDEQTLRLLQRLRLNNLAISGRLRERLDAYLAGRWMSLDSWRDPDITRLLNDILPVITAAERQMVETTNAYLASVASTAAGTSFRPPTIRYQDLTGTALRGVDPAEVFRRPQMVMNYRLAKGASLSDAIDAGANRLRSLGATNLQLAKTKTVAAQGTAPFYRRVLTGSENCALCVIASTQRYRRGKLAPIHPGCVPAGSRVAARGVLAVSRRWYTGELTILTTAGGDEVPVTANHPVLTDRGWVPAHLVRVGDDLLRSSDRHGVIDGVPQEAQGPALIEDVWGAARVSGLLRVVPLAAEDFHADSAEGEVEIVSTDSDLAPVGDVTFGQPVSEAGLGVAHHRGILLPSESDLTALLVGVDTASRRFMGSGDLSGEFCLSHLGGSVEPSLGSSARFDAPTEQFSTESAAVYSERGLDLVGRLSGHVERDRVVEFRRVSWSDHVYNLHTSEGWYSSNNHIVSNCDCGIEEIIDAQPAHVIEPALLDSTHAEIDKKLGGSDRSAQDLGRGKTDSRGRPLSDFTDLIVVRQHGELGNLLAWRSDHFRGPSEAASFAA